MISHVKNLKIKEKIRIITKNQEAVNTNMKCKGKKRGWLDKLLNCYKKIRYRKV